MTRGERAAQFWSFLVLAARTQQLLSYGLMERLTGIPKQAVGQILGPLQEYCKRNDFPPLTCLLAVPCSFSALNVAYEVPREARSVSWLPGLATGRFCARCSSDERVVRYREKFSRPCCKE